MAMDRGATAPDPRPPARSREGICQLQGSAAAVACLEAKRPSGHLVNRCNRRRWGGTTLGTIP